MSTAAHEELTLRSSDGGLVQLPLKVLQSSNFFRNIPKELFREGPVPIASINQNILEKAIGWCNYHINDDLSINQERENLNPQEWELETPRVDYSILFDLILAANFLDFTALLEHCSKKAAEMINENHLHSLNGLPDEVQLQIADKIRPYMLPKVVKAGIVPITPKLQKRAQHAYAWATILTAKDFSLFESFFGKENNAFLIGPGTKYLYNGLCGKSAEPHTPMHLFLGWPGKGPAFNPTRFRKEPFFGHTICIRNPLVNVQLCGQLKLGNTRVRDIGKLVDPETLKASVLYFRDPKFDLHEIQFGPAGLSNYGASLSKEYFPFSGNGHIYVEFKHGGQVSNEERRYLTDKQLQLPWHLRMGVLRREVDREQKKHSTDRADNVKG